MSVRCTFCDTSNPDSAASCRTCGAALLPRFDESSTAAPVAEQPVAAEAPGALTQGDLEEQIVQWLKQGQKLQAIKLHREQTGSSLIEAKEAVEAIARRHNILAGSGTGCFGLLALALLLTALFSLAR